MAGSPCPSKASPASALTCRRAPFTLEKRANRDHAHQAEQMRRQGQTVVGIVIELFPKKSRMSRPFSTSRPAAKIDSTGP